MTDECPSKSDIQLIFKRLRNLSANKVCFDCQAKNPTWASVTYGVFICIDCSAVHRGLGVHLSFVRSTQLDTNWTWLQIRHMQLGGNANASAFFVQHNCTSSDSQQKYNSRAAQLYRDKLKSSAIQAMRMHGTILHLDVQTEESQEPKEKVEDFFSEHEKLQLVPNSNDLADFDNYKLCPSNKSDSSASTPRSNGAGGDGPNVTAALSSSPKEAPTKSTIGVRKPQHKKLGLGSKKGGLGAQKVKTDFNEIEKEALMNDKLKEQAIKDAEENSKRNAELESKQLASMRLAYKDLSIQQEKETQKIKHKDPQKAEQMERLGMGLGIGARSGITHSVAGEMTTIEQEAPSGGDSSKSTMLDRAYRDYFDDEMDLLSLDLSRYKGFSHDKEKILNLYQMYVKDKEPAKSSWDSFSKEPETAEPKSFSKSNYSSDNVLSPSGGDAVKKYGNAKAISSDTYFGDRDNEYERKTTLSRFEGSSSISSADYFGRQEQSQRAAFLQAPDLDDVKESFRTGVTKLAGKLSNMANDVVTTIQDRYGS